MTSEFFINTPISRKLKTDILERLSQFQNKMCDVTLCAEVDGTKIDTHRLVLSISSKYFESMFASGMKEASDKIIYINGISGAILRNLINFLYTEEIDLNENNVQQLAEASLFLQFDIVTDYCSEFMAENLSIFNCSDLMIFAEQQNMKKLLELSTDFLMTNFELVYKQPEFNEVPVTFLAKILGKDELVVSAETSVFYAIQKWFLHDPEGRASHLMELLKFVRFSNLSSMFTGTILFDFCMKYNCDQMFSLAAILQQNSRDRNTRHLGSRENNRTLKQSKATGLIAISSTNVFHYYSSEENQWKFFKKRFSFLHPYDIKIGIGLYNTELVFLCISAKSAVVKAVDVITGREQSHVILLKSFNGAKSIIQGDAVFILSNKLLVKYDLEKRRWLYLPEPSISRNRHCLVILQNYLYAIGGDESSTVERYCFSTNRWSTCFKLTQKRVDCVATEMDGWIYLIGATYIEHFNPKDGWNQISSSTPLHTVSSAVGFDGEIYIAGSDINSQRLVVRYTPRYDQWNDMPRLKEADLTNIHLIKCDFPNNTLSFN